MKILYALFALAIAAAGAVADDDTDTDSLFGSEDDMFSGDLIEETEESDGESDEETASSLLVSEAVELGGRYSFSVEATAGWTDPATMTDRLMEADILSLSTSLSSRVFFDARPDEDFRVFGKMTVSYPFATDGNRRFEDVFHVEELFSDFTWNDTVFFRGGKQTLNWGVGYFFSPADLLNIAEIDPEDPDAEREGPVALKANVPIGVHNAYAYLLPPRVTDPVPQDLGVAARGEVVVGSGELSAGVIYQRDIAPAGMVTASFSWRDFDFFAEGVASYGSNRTFVVESSGFPGVAAETIDDEFFFNTTGGLRYSYSPVESDTTLSVVAQYLYNDEGYDDPSLITDNPTGVQALIATGELAFADLANTGRHYSAMNAGLTDLFGLDVNASVLWLHNYTDGSAMITPSLSRTFFDHFGLTLRVPILIGEESDEFAPRGNQVSVGIRASIGGGSF
jgi:hypothetical protein